MDWHCRALTASSMSFLLSCLHHGRIRRFSLTSELSIRTKKLIFLFSNILIDHICSHSFSCSHSLTRLCIGKREKGNLTVINKQLRYTDDLTANLDIVIVSETVHAASGVGGTNPNDECSTILSEVCV